MSKQSLPISLLIILISACSQQVATLPPTAEETQNAQPAPSHTREPESTPTLMMFDLAATEKALPRPTLIPTTISVDTTTAASLLCPGAPGPYAAVGSQVTVVAEDADKLKLRSMPDLSPGTVIRDLNRFTQMQIVGGPVCVREPGASYWFWQVQVDGETGWVAEGNVQHSFIVVSVGKQYVSTATPEIATTGLACSKAHEPLEPGTQVTVIADNSDKLKLRSEPKISADTVMRELDQFAELQVVGGPMCVTAAETGISYWLWKVKVITTGKVGWVAEGDGQHYYLEANLPP